MNVDESELVKGLIDGDGRAFDRFADAYLPALYRFASRRLCGDRELTREIVQMTVCKVFANLRSFRGEAALLTWMGTICRNEIALHFRQQSRRPQETEWTSEAEIVGAEDLDAEQSLLRDERSNLVHIVLDLLPSHYAQALEWKYLENLSVKEMAERLQMSSKAVESLLTRARQTFRETFDHHIDHLETAAESVAISRRKAVSES